MYIIFYDLENNRFRDRAFSAFCCVHHLCDLMHAKRIQINCLTKQWIIKISMGFGCNQLCRLKNVLGTPIARTPCTEPKRKIRLFEPSIFTTLLPLNVNCERIADAGQNDCNFSPSLKRTEEPRNIYEKWKMDWQAIVLWLFHCFFFQLSMRITHKSFTSDRRHTEPFTHFWILAQEWHDSRMHHVENHAPFCVFIVEMIFFSMKTNRVDDKSTNTISQLDSRTWVLATREKWVTLVRRSSSPFCQNTYRICIWIFYLNFFPLQSSVEVECHPQWVERRWYWKCIYCY